jgi:hypothetical protein
MKKLLLTTALALAAAAPSADAAEVRVFKVVAQGSGQYTQLDEHADPAAGFERFTGVDFTYTLDLGTVSFVDDGGGIVNGDFTPRGTFAVTNGKHTVHQWAQVGDISHHTRGECSGTPTIVSTPALSSSDLSGSPRGETERGATLTIEPRFAGPLAATCTGDIRHESALGFEPWAEMLNTSFFLPRSATRQDKVIQIVNSSEANGKGAPCSQYTKLCELKWEGTVTLDYLRTEQRPGELPDWVLPLVPEPPQQQQQPAAVVPAGAKLARDRRSASVQVKCAAACTGTVSAYPMGARIARGPKPLAKRKFKAPAGKAVTVKLTFRGKALKTARRSKALRLVIESGGTRKTVVARRGR